MYAMYACSLSALLKSRRDSASSGDVWKSIADIPVTWATCVSVQNRILAVGGRQPEKKEESRAIHMYDPLSQLFFFPSIISSGNKQIIFRTECNGPPSPSRHWWEFPFSMVYC